MGNFLHNRNDQPFLLEFDRSKQEMGDDLNIRTLDFHNQTYEIRDLFKHELTGNTSEPLKATLAIHDVLLTRLMKTGK